MSQENVEIMREGWMAYRERGVDGALDYFAEDCVCENLPEGPESATTYEGWDGVRERDKLFTEIWGDLVLEPVGFIDAGEDVVVTVISMRARGKGSGVPIDAPMAFVTEFRDGKIVRDRPFTSRAEALEAAGLEGRRCRGRTWRSRVRCSPSSTNAASRPRQTPSAICSIQSLDSRKRPMSRTARAIRGEKRSSPTWQSLKRPLGS